MYYQPQLANYNQCQRYPCDITTKQAPYRTDYDRGEVEKRGIIHSLIPSPDKNQLSIIPLYIKPYYSKITPTIYSGDSLKTETSKIHQLKSQPKLPSKDKKPNPSSLDVASSWPWTELYYTGAIDPKSTKKELIMMVNQ